MHFLCVALKTQMIFDCISAINTCLSIEHASSFFINVCVTISNHLHFKKMNQGNVSHLCSRWLFIDFHLFFYSYAGTEFQGDVQWII